MVMWLNTVKINEIVEKKGLKKKWLIENSGVSRRTFYIYFYNRRKARSEFITKLAINLGVTVKDITVT